MIVDPSVQSTRIALGILVALRGPRRRTFGVAHDTSLVLLSLSGGRYARAAGD